MLQHFQEIFQPKVLPFVVDVQVSLCLFFEEVQKHQKKTKEVDEEEI